MKIKIIDKILNLEKGFNVLVEHRHVFDDFLKVFNYDNTRGFLTGKPFRTKEEELEIDMNSKVFYLDDVYCMSAWMSSSKNTDDIKSYGNEAIKSFIKHLESNKYDLIVVNDVINKIKPMLQIDLIKKLYSLDSHILFIEKNPLIFQLCGMKVNWFISEEAEAEMKLYQYSIKNYDTRK